VKKHLILVCLLLLNLPACKPSEKEASDTSKTVTTQSKPSQAELEKELDHFIKTRFIDFNFKATYELLSSRKKVGPQEKHLKKYLDENKNMPIYKLLKGHVTPHIDTVKMNSKTGVALVTFKQPDISDAMKAIMQKTIAAMKAEQGKANLKPVELAPQWVDEEVIKRGKNIKLISQTWRFLFTFDQGKWRVFDYFLEKPPIPKSIESAFDKPIELAKDQAGPLNFTVKGAEYVKAPAANAFDDVYFLRVDLSLENRMKTPFDLRHFKVPITVVSNDGFRFEMPSQFISAFDRFYKKKLFKAFRKRNTLEQGAVVQGDVLIPIRNFISQPKLEIIQGIDATHTNPKDWVRVNFKLPEFPPKASS